MEKTDALPGNARNIHIILQRPQLAENIGMCMRAMVNCGCLNLRIVSPQCEWPSKTADLLSAEKSHLLNITVYNSLQSAISDMNMVFATTARTRNMIKSSCDPESAKTIIDSVSGAKIGIVFGPESSGLSNEEVALCNQIISIPSANFSSYNLAQAVLIICYTLMPVTFSTETVHLGKTRLASNAEIMNLVHFLDELLTSKNYFKSEKKHLLMMQTLQNFITRSNPTLQEIRSLFGAIKCLTKS